MDNLLEGKNICVMTSGKNYPSIEELEKLVIEHGGNTVKNPCPITTYAVIVGDISFRVKSIVSSNKYNFVKVDWLLRALEGPQNGNNLLAFTPHDMVASKSELLDEFRDRFDEFGDSYTELVDEERLRTIMFKMTDLPYQLLKSEIHKFEMKLKFNFNFYRLIFGHFFDDENSVSLGKMALRLRGGTVIESVRKCYQITHIFVNLENLDRKRLTEFVKQLNLRHLKIISLEWIFRSNELKESCKEDEFLIEL